MSSSYPGSTLVVRLTDYRPRKRNSLLLFTVLLLFLSSLSVYPSRPTSLRPYYSWIFVNHFRLIGHSFFLDFLHSLPSCSLCYPSRRPLYPLWCKSLSLLWSPKLSLNCFHFIYEDSWSACRRLRVYRPTGSTIDSDFFVWKGDLRNF